MGFGRGKGMGGLGKKRGYVMSRADNMRMLQAVT